ncbi:MAG: hypothetical protein NTW29_16705 [Bacteroidetes bacterium]|nr:hypothetical protein [Bacteroidota bacterium]
MKKYAPYIFVTLLITGMVLLFVTGKKNGPKKLNERISLRPADKIPYGHFVAYECLPYIFPEARIITSPDEPGFWDSLSTYDGGQAYIVVSDYFSATRDEMRRMIKFASNGNDVFVSTRSISGAVSDMLNCSVYDYSVPSFSQNDAGELIAKDDSLKVRMRAPYFEDDSMFEYPGRRFSSGFTKVDNTIAEEIGEDERKNTNFIHLKCGKGNFYLHLAPLAFSNYFLLYKKNIRYYEMAFSVMDRSASKVVWDEYFMSKDVRVRRSGNGSSSSSEDDGNSSSNQDKDRNWLAVLLSYPALRAALLVGMLTLLLYVLLEMRRKQRYIPVVAKPRNDSLDFVKTIGRLYHDKGDHRNLARKMASYFMEYVRATYKIPTGNMDETFIKTVQYKSGVPDYEIRSIVSFIKYLDDTAVISQVQLTDFHRELENFYAKA